MSLILVEIVIKLKLLDRKWQLSLILASLIFSIAISTLLYYYLHDNKRLLNIITFPFHLLGAYLLVKIMELLVDYQFPKDSFWHCEKDEYIPLFIRARTFLPIPIGILVLSVALFNLYVDWRTGLLSNPKILFRLVIYFNWIVFGLFIVIRIKRYILNFDKIIDNFRNLFDNKEYSKFKISAKKSLLNKNEIVTISIIIVQMRLSEILFPFSTWETAKHIFPLTPIWWSFIPELFYICLYMVLGSFFYTYYKFGKILYSLSKIKKIKIDLFHPDGYSGLKIIADYLFSITSTILFLIGLFGFNLYLALRLTYTSSQITNLIITSLLIMCIYVFLTYIFPLFGLRNLIKEKKREERKVLLSMIREIEKSILQESSKKKIFFTSLEKMHNATSILDKVDSVGEWPISRRTMALLVPMIIFLFKIIFEIVIRYLIK